MDPDTLAVLDDEQLDRLIAGYEIRLNAYGMNARLRDLDRTCRTLDLLRTERDIRNGFDA